MSTLGNLLRILDSLDAAGGRFLEQLVDRGTKQQRVWEQKLSGQRGWPFLLLFLPVCERKGGVCACERHLSDPECLGFGVYPINSNSHRSLSCLYSPFISLVFHSPKNFPLICLPRCLSLKVCVFYVCINACSFYLSLTHAICLLSFPSMLFLLRFFPPFLSF